MSLTRHWKCLGPIALSALSLTISFFILQPLALAFGVTLLTSRGIGKVAFITMVMYQILLFISVQSPQFLKNFFNRVLFFFTRESWLIPFSRYFVTFFTLHSLVLLLTYLSGYMVYNNQWGVFSCALVAKTLFGLFVVFMLAWTEELIFRGTLYPYFRQYYPKLSSLFLTSFIFMIVHDLKNPLALLTTEWKLGLGLFLLGVLLNQIFIITKKLYTGMGVHAGLVFVKVVLRRARFIVFIDSSQWSWWIHQDLRQSHMVHILFVLTILFLFYKHSEKFGFSSKNLKTLA